MSAHSTQRGISHHRHVPTVLLPCFFAALLLSPSAAADDPQRVTVMIAAKEPCRVAAEALIQRLRSEETNCELLIVSGDDDADRREALERLRQSPPTLVVTAGTTMSSEVLEAVPRIPVVFCLKPNILDADYLRENSPHRDRVAGVTSDVAPDEQIEWIRRTQPGARRIAVLCSERSRRTAEALAAAGRTRGIEIKPLRATHDQFPAAIDALTAGDFDGVLMIPDARVYNSPSVQRLLLWGLRSKRPVWAFSDNVVKAGALAGIYSDPVQVGNQTAEVVREILSGTDPAAIGLRYLRSPQRAINLHTAEMIGVRFDSQTLGPDVQKFGGQE